MSLCFFWGDFRLLRGLSLCGLLALFFFADFPMQKQRQQTAQQETDVFTSSAGSAPTGALVVAEGADDMQVRLNLIRAVRTLLGLPETAVDVFVMEGKP